MRDRRDPICLRGREKHHEPVGRIAWPTGMPEPGQSHASTYVCVSAACQDDAVRWVEEITGHRGEFVSFPGREQSTAEQLNLFAEQP